MFVSNLSDRDIRLIHEKSLDILWKIGVVVPHKDMLNRFADSGAKVNRDTQTVKIPSDLLQKCLQAAGKSFCLYGRNTEKKASFGKGKRNYNTSAGQALWIDEIRGQRRYPSLEEVGIATRMGDALPFITIPGAMADPEEIPTSWRCVAVAAEMIKNTTKPITFWLHDRASAKYLVDLVIALRGNLKQAEKYPLFYPFLEPISPLRFPFNGIDLLYETAKINLPVPIGPMAQMGISAPVTLAGVMAQQNSEILAGICITQLIRMGMPVCYGGICHAFDMNTTQMIFGGPEQAIFGVAMTQMGKFYGLPVYVNAGLTDSNCPDAQAGLECGITLALAVAAGADIFGHLGICGVDQAASLDMLLLQHEIINYLESVNRGISFTEDAFAIAALEQVCTKSENFIEHEHTLKNFRQELWFPELLDRNFYQRWMDQGGTSMGERCRALKNDLMSSHEVPPLEEGTIQNINGIVKQAERELPP